MTRKPDTPCSGCGNLLWSGTGSRPAGNRMCRTCRAEHRAANSTARTADDGRPIAPRAGRKNSLAAVVAAGDRRQSLEGVRDCYARLIDDPETAPRDAIAAGKELRAVIAELDNLDGAAKEVRGSDDLAARRAARRAAAGL